MFPWLEGVHMHIGSQGSSHEVLLSAIEKLFDLVLCINHARPGNPVRFVDIGGGLPIQYDDDDQAITVAEYALLLGSRLPALFSDDYTMITEFGRYLFGNAAWAVSRVEYVKQDGTLFTGILHFGADMLLRECYDPDSWRHQYFALDAAGGLKSADLKAHNLAGPLCFAGDMIATWVQLPQLVPGDYLVVRDVGAYTLGMWSRYVSRQMPKVLGYSIVSQQPTTVNWSVLKPRETIDNVLRSGIEGDSFYIEGKPMKDHATERQGILVAYEQAFENLRSLDNSYVQVSLLYMAMLSTTSVTRPRFEDRSTV